MRTVKRITTLLILVVLVLVGYQVKLGYDKYKKALEKMPLEDRLLDLQEQDNYTSYGNIPQIYFDAVVAVEDRRFYMHNGFDIIGIARAVYTDIKERALVEGGSTVSQQLAKNLYFMQDNSPSRKAAEIFMALKIEREYSKQEILEFYANVIYFGSGYYCIYDAARGYFAVKPENLSDYECTMLAGIPNAPSLYSPKVNPELAEKRQEVVLDRMITCGYIESREEILTKH